MRRFLVIVCGVFLILSFFWVTSVNASFCQNYYEQLVCILSVQRSAKNYWEYRASISVDGTVRPLEVYDCRQKIRIQKDGTVIPFKVNDPGKLICTVLNKS